MCADFATPTLLRGLCNPLRDLCVPTSDYLPMCLSNFSTFHRSNPVPVAFHRHGFDARRLPQTRGNREKPTQGAKANYEISARAFVSPTVFHTFFSFIFQEFYWRTRSRPNESPPGRNSRSPQPRRQPPLLPLAAPPRRVTCARMKTRMQRYSLESKLMVLNLFEVRKHFWLYEKFAKIEQQN